MPDPGKPLSKLKTKQKSQVDSAGKIAKPRVARGVRGGRYLFGQKLSDYMVEQVLLGFAHGMSAAAFAASPAGKNISRNTIYDLFDLVRRRLLDIGYFEEPENYYKFWMGDEERRADFIFSDAAARIAAEEARLNGASQKSARYILAEIIFRAEHPDLSPSALLNDIKLAIKLTGPLNKRPVNLGTYSARAYLVEIDRQISSLRRDRRTYSPELLQSLQNIRSSTLIKLRRT